jgi:carbon-monoxide dehydrogenase medium subunit
MALDAQVEIADTTERARGAPGLVQWRPVGELFLGPGKSAVDPRRQMITAIRFPALQVHQGSAWERIGRRRALVLPILNCGVSVALNGERLEWARIGLGPVAPVPFRAQETEAFLAGRPATRETFAQAGDIASKEAQPRTSLLRASKEYRLEVLKVLIRQGLTRAVEQARDHVA